MKRKLWFTPLFLFTFLLCNAQKKNYFSFENGVYFGNTNSNIAAGMVSSGLNDTEAADFFLFTITTDYPRKKTDNTSYRVKFGHYLNDKTAIEAGFGLSYSGEVKGYDEKGLGQSSNYLTLTSNINTLYIAFVKTDTRGATGFGIGPAFSFYKLTKDINRGSIKQSKNYFLPGAMMNGFWNFVSRPSCFVGIGTELLFTTQAKIDEIKITTQTSTSTFKSTKAGSFNGNISLNAGFRF